MHIKAIVYICIPQNHTNLFLGGPGRGPGPWEPLGSPRTARYDEKLEVCLNRPLGIYCLFSPSSLCVEYCRYTDRSPSAPLAYISRMFDHLHCLPILAGIQPKVLVFIYLSSSGEVHK